jgi:hypothetical protein
MHRYSLEIVRCMCSRVNSSVEIHLDYHQIIHDAHRTWKEYLFDSQFYLIALLWMLTRVISNISQVYLPLYIMNIADLNQVDQVRR